MNAPARPGRLTTRVALVGDHPLVLGGIRAALEQCEEIRVAGCAQCCEEALPLLPGADAVLVHLCPLSPARLAELRTLGANGGGGKILLVACPPFDEQTVRSAVESGVSGFMTTASESQALIGAVREVGCGAKAFCREAVEALVATVGVRRTDPARLVTSREAQVWRLLAEGKTNAEIAAELWLSERTVKFHITHILRKTGARSRAEAASLAYRSGLMRVSC